QRTFRGSQRAGESFGTLPIVPRPMIAPDRMMMRDRPALLDQVVRYRSFDLVPLLNLGAALARRDHGVIRRGTVGVNVRESARHRALAAYSADRIARAFHHLAMKVWKPLPRDRGLESIADHAER